MVNISIIVPVFNGEPFLRKCIDSILAQSFRHFEVLLIDDASTDCSLKILNDCANFDRRLHVYSHDVNKGAPSARNLGIQNAIGDYIMFVDSDDELEQNALAILHQQAINYGADGVKGTVTYKYKNIDYAWRINQRSYPTTLIPGIKFEDCSMIWHLKEYQTYIFKKELILDNAIIFDESLSACQDIPFLAQVLCKSKILTLVPENVYIHRNHGNSIVNKKWSFKEYNSLIEGYALTADVLTRKGYHKVAEFFCSSLVDYWRKFIAMPRLLTDQECYCIFSKTRELYEQTKKPLWKEKRHPCSTSYFLLISGGSYSQALKLLKKQSSVANRMVRFADKILRIMGAAKNLIMTGPKLITTNKKVH